jgi:CheY-like chemotaxis protein
MLESQELTILLVEDDLGHARLVERNLRRANIHNPIRHFANGQQILTYFFGEKDLVEGQRISHSLMLLDLDLPIVNGYEVLRRVKEDPRTKRLPVVILTATDDAHRLSECYQLGCSVCVTKPVRYEDLAEAIRALGLFLSVITVPTGG